MRRRQRLIAACVLVAFSGVLGGCSSSGFDPTDLLDFLDTKKKLPGDRKPVFPDGVPGLEQGVPKDLYKGAQQQQTDPNAQAAAAAAAQPPEPPKSKAGKSKKTKQNASTTLTPADAAAASGAEAAPEEDTTPAAPPAPKPKKIARKRTTAPDQPDGQPAQESQAPFPAPVPSGTFTR